MAERLEQLSARRPARRGATARPDEVPGRESFVLGQWLEERRGCVVRERQEGEAATTVDGCDGTRREAAETSAAVEEDDRSDEDGHELILPGIARPRLVRVSHVIEHHRSWALVLLFLLVAVESAGVPLPGETALVASGVLASQGKLDIVAVIVIASPAAIVGDNIGYWIGRKGGRVLLERWSLVSRHANKVLPRAERLFAKHGGKTVFFGRFVAILRFTAAWLAGISHMPWLRFLRLQRRRRHPLGHARRADRVLRRRSSGGRHSDVRAVRGRRHRRRNGGRRAGPALVGAADARERGVAGRRIGRRRVPWLSGGSFVRRKDSGASLPLPR